MLTDKLHQVPLFRGLSPTDVKLFLSCAEEVSVSAGDVLMETGQICRAIYYILDGDVLVKVQDEAAAPTMVDVFPSGSLVGWSALVPPYLSTATLTTVTDSVLIRFDGVKLRDLCEAHPAQGYQIMVNMAALISQRLASARARYAALLNRTKGHLHK